MGDKLIEIDEIKEYIQDNMTFNNEESFASIDVEKMLKWLEILRKEQKDEM